jgi:hypothetical protein
MNDFTDNFENELKRLQPAPPPTRLAGAIDEALRTTAPRQSAARVRFSLWASWTVTAAAACVAAAAWWQVPHARANSSTPTSPIAATEDSTPAENADPRIVPVGTSNVLFDARDEGLVRLGDGQAARKFRLRYVDTVQLRADDTQASIAVSRPREEVRFVPVNFY